MQSYFPTNSSGSSELISFNAGKCNLTGPNPNGKFHVTPDARKGKLSLERTPDGLVCFKWTNRNSGQVEEERVIFPNQMTFKRAKTGNEADRVYVLSFPANRQNFLFWMQNKSAEKDAEYCAKFTEFANNPPAQQETSNDWMQMMGLSGLDINLPGHMSIPGVTPGIFQAAANPLVGNLDLSSLFAGAGAPTPAAVPSAAVTPATPVVPTSSSAVSAPVVADASGNALPPITLADLQQAMGLGPGASVGGMGMGRRRRPLGLENVLTAEAISNSGILEDPTVREALIAHLPSGQQNEQSLQETIHCPQFQQSIRSFTNALHSDGYSAIMSNLGIDASPGIAQMMQGDNVRAMLTSLQAAYPPQPAAATINVTASETSAANESRDEAAGMDVEQTNEDKPQQDPSS